jgi:hypothetical protein
MAASAARAILATRRPVAPGKLDDRSLVVDESVKRDRTGEPTFRLRHSVAWGWAIFCGGLMPIACMAFSLHVVFVPVAALVGYLIGKRFPKYVCTSPDCRSKMKADSAHCPSCGRRVVRTITREADRLED